MKAGQRHSSEAELFDTVWQICTGEICAVNEVPDFFFYYLAVPLVPINTSCQSPTALKIRLCTVYRGLC